MRKLHALVFTTMILLSMAMSAVAVEYITISRENGMSAFAEWIETEGSVSTYTDLFAMKTDGGTDIGVSICTYDSKRDYLSCKSGYTFTQDNVFSIDQQLNSAILSDADVDLYTCSKKTCTITETLKVKAEWQGTGDVTKGSYRWRSTYGDYSAKGSDSSISRDAIATGSLNGNVLGLSDFASMAKFKSVYMEMQK